MVRFARLDEHGQEHDVKTIPQSRIAACPHVIFVPEHYRDDSTCRCDDPDHTEMKEWGYTWDGKEWVS